MEGLLQEYNFLDSVEGALHGVRQSVGVTMENVKQSVGVTMEIVVYVDDAPQCCKR